MSTYVAYSPSSTVDRALFNFDAFGLANFRASATIRLSTSDSFSFEDYVSPSYSNFLPALVTQASAEVPWSSLMIQNVIEIAGIFSQFANVQFQWIADYESLGSDTTVNPEDVGRANVSDINITFLYRADVNFSGISGISSDNSFGYTGAAGDIFLNAYGIDDATLGPNSDIRQTLMHEIGHSLGLSHPHTAYSNNIPTLTADYIATKDIGFSALGFRTGNGVDMYKEYFSIMTYDDQASFLGFIPWNAHTPMILDVIALHKAYGEGAGTSGPGDDTISAGTAGYRTYFDKGGLDTIDLSAYTEGAYLHMGTAIAGADHLVGVAMSLYDALNTVINGADPAHLRWFYGEYENANTSSANDLIQGNSLDNVINSRGGNDVVYGGDGRDTISGGDGDDTLVGHESIFDAVRDTLDGGAGNDTLYGEASDSILGGPGRDLLYIVNSNPIHVNLGLTGIEWITSDFGDDVIDGSSQAVAIEAYSDGGNDTITGSAFNDIIWSGSGNDTVNAGAGNDVVVAHIGTDTISGGDGNDSLYLDNSDTVDGGAGRDAVYITGGSGLVINMALRSIEWLADFVLGSDTIDGSMSASSLEVYAGGGNDAVAGGSQGDFLWGGSGTDTLFGNAGNDTLVGEGGADTLNGGQGIDSLYGNSGNGGDGAADRYVFNDGWGTDFVFDFDNGIDKLDVSSVTGLGSFANLTVQNTSDGHAYVRFGVQLIAVAKAAGQIDATDFLF